MFWIIASTVVAAFMATTMIFVRLKASQQPASVKKIILPPIFMSTGAFMFIFPVFRVSWSQVLEALVVGMIFSIFLIKTSRFEIKDNEIYLIPSKAFVFILFGLLAVRLLAKTYLGTKVSLGETSGMFFLLAFGMIATWRIAMLIKYKKLETKLNEKMSLD
ncbi:membrane protein CcdC involved in cytochrome C biogenesis [Cerasibacillus quisquiliarum]|uniref:Protein CcdC n=1 Tax=Cerasibacillus quisquiliarum TaxID=227865 RepID=A0A511UVD8_9BACI|nr:cytochrome c biogenesis protein CcdC [Cerasibacillus quisquiliarum]MBB5145954.1 membrane protein CcdC involved in cytochrome C biogenesis [Cerasibacillus quisquiliarum]GEN30524.1 protein CcdC [Cerasibacillus quisquiliarum]